MTKLRGLFWKVLLPAALGIFVVALAVPRMLPPPSVRTRKADANEKRAVVPVSFLSLPLAGTGSCSARGCHGGIEPVLDAALCRQNEYADWAHDRHADAYRVLFNKRSQQMVKLLGGPAKAHEDARCLACHTNPQLAKRIIQDDHELANHTWSHGAMRTMTARQLDAEIAQAAAALVAATGTPGRWFRPSQIEVPTDAILAAARTHVRRPPAIVAS